MTEVYAAYEPSVLALGLLGALYLLQLLVADVTAMARKHTPGLPVQGGHDDFLFRAVRAHANTTESVGAVILIAGFAILRGGDPAWVNGGLSLYVASRASHALAYYLDLRMLRSIVFGLGIASLVAVFLVGLNP